MTSIFELLDYRDYLKSHYEIKKKGNRYFSYKVFANAVGMDQSHLAKVLMHHMHLPPDKISHFTRYLDLQGSEKEYFESLVHFGRAVSPSEVKLWFEKLQLIRPPQFRVITNDQFEYFSHWYTPVIRSLLGIIGECSPTDLSSRIQPKISAAEVNAAIELLFRLGMIEKNESQWKLSEPHIGSGQVSNSRVLREYHRQVLDIAVGSIDTIPIQNRDISSLVIAIDDFAFDDIRSMTRDFRMAIQKRIDQVEHANRVYHFNIQIVPVANSNP